MKLHRLRQLKRKLIQEKDFSDIWTFYMDEFADHPEFIEVGEAVENDFLAGIIPQICEQMFGKKVKITDMLLIYIAEYKFFHAPFQVEGRIGGLIYFEEENTGLLAVSSPLPFTDEVKFSRFSISPLKRKAPPFYELN